MMLFKSFLFGLCGAVAAAIIWIVAAFILPIVIQVTAARGQGGGGIGVGAVSIGEGSVLLAALVGFIAPVSFSLMRRRAH